MEKKRNISNETIKRMIVYLRYLDMLKKKGVKVFSSTDITSFLNIQPSQFRKDLSFFGEFGKRGVGYNVDDLYKAIRIILGVNKEKEVALVGVGKLGSALMQYSGFLKINVTIVACFDKNPNKVGTIIEGKKIYDINDANKVIKKLGIKIALLCVPVEEAQKTAEHIVSLGIKGILNFAPTTLVLPNYVYVSNVDMASELGNIIYYLQ